MLPPKKTQKTKTKTKKQKRKEKKEQKEERKKERKNLMRDIYVRNTLRSEIGYKTHDKRTCFQMNKFNITVLNDRLLAFLICVEKQRKRILTVVSG